MKSLFDNIENNANELKCAEVQISYRRSVNYSSLGVIDMPDKAADILRSVIPADSIEYREYFYILLLNRAGQVLGATKISEGGTWCTTVDIKIIFQAALLANAHALILCHNHPSGTQRPSPEDDRLTKKICDAAKLLDIRINDHIILTAESFYSYADNGRI